jgi:hypothetical protein
MGTWGPGLFSNDTAADTREEYLELLGDGIDPDEAVAQLVANPQDTIDDIDDGPPFWLALAATQCKYGHLSPLVRARAIEIISSGKDLRRWDSSKRDRKRRATVLEKLAREIEQFRPFERHVPKRKKDATPYEKGDILTYRLLSGRITLFRVIGHHSDKGGRSAVVEVLPWNKTEGPLEKEMRGGIIDRLFGRPRIRHLVANGSRPVSQFMISALMGNPKDRVNLVSRRMPVSQKLGGYTCTFWSRLDDDLKEWFGLT